MTYDREKGIREIEDFLNCIDWDAYDEFVGQEIAKMGPREVESGDAPPDPVRPPLFVAYEAAGRDLNKMAFNDLAILRHTLTEAANLVNHIYVIRMINDPLLEAASPHAIQS